MGIAPIDWWTTSGAGRDWRSIPQELMQLEWAFIFQCGDESVSDCYNKPGVFGSPTVGFDPANLGAALAAVVTRPGSPPTVGGGHTPRFFRPSMPVASAHHSDARG